MEAIDVNYPPPNGSGFPPKQIRKDDFMKELSQVELENIYGGYNILVVRILTSCVLTGFIGMTLGRGAIKIAKKITTHNYTQAFDEFIETGLEICSVFSETR